MRIIQPLPTAQTPQTGQRTDVFGATSAASTDTATPAHRNRFATNRTAGTMPVWKPQAIAESFAPEGDVPKIEAGTQPKLGFKDFIDVINPLQHIPFVGMMYRKATGDTISAPAQFAGGMLFGGPIGGAAALADIAVREQTGRGLADRMMAGVTGTPSQEDSPVVFKMASHWVEPERMAGYQPVWGKANNTADLTAPVTELAQTTIPGQKLSSQTSFAMLLNDLSSTTPNIS